MQSRESYENAKHLLFIKRKEAEDLQHKIQVLQKDKKDILEAATRALEINEQLLTAITEAGMYLDADMHLQFTEAAKDHLRDACERGQLWD